MYAVISIQRSSRLFISQVITNTAVFFLVGGVINCFAPSCYSQILNLDKYVRLQPAIINVISMIIMIKM